MNGKKWLYWFVYSLVLIVGVVVIHEGAHLVSALILGVPFNEIIVGLIGTNPGVTIPERYADSNLSLYHWSGGITVGVTYLLLYFLVWFRRYKHNPSRIHSLLGLTTIAIAMFQLAQGYIEGRFHHAYIVLAGQMLNPFYIIYAVVLLASFFVHYSLFPRPDVIKND